MLSTYIAYVVIYIVELISGDDDEPEIYYWHSDHERVQAIVKGWLLFMSITVSSVLLGVSYVNAVFVNPGNIPSNEKWAFKE